MQRVADFAAWATRVTEETDEASAVRGRKGARGVARRRLDGTGSAGGDGAEMTAGAAMTEVTRESSTMGSDETHGASQRGRSGAKLQSASPGDRPAVSGANTCKPKTTRPRASSIGDKGDPQRDSQTPSSVTSSTANASEERRAASAASGGSAANAACAAERAIRFPQSTTSATTQPGIQIGARARRTVPAGHGFKVTDVLGESTEEENDGSRANGAELRRLLGDGSSAVRRDGSRPPSDDDNTTSNLFSDEEETKVIGWDMNLASIVGTLVK